MPTLRLGTFNVENLFARFKFNSNVNPDTAVRDGWDVSKTHFDILDEASKQITGALIRSTGADVLCLQEVENLDTLKHFRADYIRGGRSTYPYALSIDGNDKRLIDVAVLSKNPIVRARSNQELRIGRSYIFSRDCLELEIDVDGSPLYLFINHLKSMLDKKDPKNGRKNTFAKRQLQAQTVRQIVEERFGKKAGSKPFVVLGDLNDYMQVDEFGEPAIGDLVDWNQVENVVLRRPAEEQWTHYQAKRGAVPASYQQLDYLLVSRSLAQATDAEPEIFRKGLARNADGYSGPRFPKVGARKPVASDHCPVVIELKL
jgi:endonuclease/exonuclease/phosphatase family metal-dependent hydrolase